MDDALMGASSFLLTDLLLMQTLPLAFTMNFITKKIFPTFSQAIFIIILIVALGGLARSEKLEIKCLQRESQALLEFRGGLTDDYDGRLSSWENGTDCCQWEGILCNNRSNRVVALDLSTFFSLGGKMISPSLLELDELYYLDLSFIDFNETQIPEFIGSLGKLQYLKLRLCSFGGMIPHSLHNLSMLQYLDLSLNWAVRSNLGWFSGFPSLEYLNLRGNRLEGSVSEFLQNLTLLSYLDLSYNHLQDSVSEFLGNLTHLSYLDLSHNYYMSEGSIPQALGNLASLSHLALSSIQLEGSIPNAIGNLKSLSHLDLSNNQLQGSIPKALGNLTSLSHLDFSNNQLQLIEFPDQLSLSSLALLNFSHNKLQGELTHLMMQLWNSTLLKYIDLSDNALFGSLDSLGLPSLEFLDMSRNQLTGSVPNLSSCSSLIELRLQENNFNGILTESIGNLFKLEYLYLGSNNLEGEISEAHLFNLSSLQLLNLSFNSNLTVRISPFWYHPFQLSTLILGNCRLGPHFPMWLQRQRSISMLDISNAKIFDTIPNWFWNNTQLRHLNMSHNVIHGALPDLSYFLASLQSVDLSFNQFTGTLPPMPLYAREIKFSRNRFVGTIANLCNLRYSYVLDVSSNLLSGHISPDCFMNLTSMFYLNLANNNLSGNIQANRLSCSLLSLYLRNNSFTGYIPKSFAGCHRLILLDLGENKFHGEVPSWLGENMTELVVLSLKSNQFHGSLPSSLCGLSRIQVLDISMNKISGAIPRCLNNFMMLSSKSNFSSTGLHYSVQGVNGTSLQNSASIMWKGKIAEYINTLWLLKAIDFSNNNLSGEIPHEITSLTELITLNLSMNNLVGSIPRDIGHLELLNSLDLSQNNLSGSIPSTISQLSHLGVLDLSFNNLSGKIPWDSHTDTFDASSYMGNPGLCGPPLVSKPCPEDEKKPRKAHKTEHENMLQSREVFISLVVGFSIAFWGTCWTLFLNKKWNAATNKMFITVEDWLYVKILVNKRRLQRYFGHVI